MRKWREHLSALGRVELFDYDYMREGRKRPDPLPVLIAAHRAALDRVRRPNESIFLIGKSMGGRIGCHVALEEPVNGVICLGYPLCSAGDRTKLRDKVLCDLKTPILFVQGTRDPLCPLDLLEEVRTRMTAPTRLHIVEGGDHSLMATRSILKTAGKTQDEIEREALKTISSFVDQTPERNS